MKIYKNEVAVVADTHLGIHQSNNMWHETSVSFANWLKQTLNGRNIKDIIILGDILDNRNEVSVTTLHILYKFFKILEDFNIIIIAGNHDCYYSKRSDIHSLGTLNDWPNIEVFSGKPVTINQFGKALTFCPWNTPVNDIPKSDIIFGHFEINTFKMNGNYICEHGVDAQELLDKSPLIVSGHFHRTEERNYKNGKILYVGSPYEQNWGESGDPKGIYILDIEDNKLEFVTNTKSPKHIKIRLSELLAVGKISDNIKEEFKGNIVNFVIDTEIDQKIIDSIVSKLYALNPLTIKTENLLLAPKIISTDEEIVFEGIDIKNDIIKFISEAESVENRESLIKYLSDVYDQCNNGVKK